MYTRERDVELPLNCPHCGQSFVGKNKLAEISLQATRQFLEVGRDGTVEEWGSCENLDGDMTVAYWCMTCDTEVASGKEITLPCIERPQPPDHECSNEMRAGWAAASLVVFSNEHGIQDEDMATQVSDFLADLHHLADTLKIDWDNVLVRADGHYLEEVSDEKQSEDRRVR
jgi:hypothetical protein